MQPARSIEASSSHLYAIAASEAQDDAVVAHVVKHWPRDDWPKGIIFLPNRRSVTLVRAAFLRHLGAQSALLPSMLPLADIDPYLALLSKDTELQTRPPMLSPLKRKWILAQQVRQFFDAKKEPCTMRYALTMAEALGQFLDECVRYDAHCADFSALVPAQFSGHWQKTLAFLAIVLEHWPAIEREQGAVSQAAFVHAGLKTLAAAWRDVSPDIPILAAGSTGSQPATAELLSVIASLPRGAVLLPGVPRAFVPSEVKLGHPLYHIAHLAQLCGRSLGDIGIIEATASVAEAFVAASFDESMDAVAVPEHHHAVACADEWEEARVVALIVRQTLEHPGQNVMVVSPEHALLRRAGNLLKRWNIEADSSSAMRLTDHPFMQWTLRLMRLVEGQAAPLDVLAFLQHPLTFARQESIRAFAVQWIDRHYARGLMRSRGQMPLERVLLMPNIPSEFHDGASLLRSSLRNLFEGDKKGADLRGWMELILSVAKALEADIAIDDDMELFIERLVSDSDGELMSMEECKLLVEHAADMPWFASGQSEYHPRVMLHSPIEARMARADVVVLAGLNEDIWPKVSRNPWINRTMQLQLGLPTAEHELSLAAHDFLTLASRQRVYYTHAERVAGKVVSPSRWWQRIEMQAARAGKTLETAQAKQLRLWAKQMDEAAFFSPAKAPKPSPPVATRPHQLRATEMESLLFNPYAVYARHVLRLEEPQDIDREPDNALFGTLAHRMLERALAQKETLDDMAIARLAAQAVAQYSDSPSVALLWQPRMERILRFFIMHDDARRDEVEEVYSEVESILQLSLPSGEVSFIGQADRVEHRRDGEIGIGDYKSGSFIPSGAEIERGEAPQLPLYYMAHLQKKGELRQLSEHTAHIAYWHLPSGANDGEVKDFTLAGERVSALMQAYIGLCEAYLFNETPLLYSPYGARGGYRYDALARAGEWGGAESA